MDRLKGEGIAYNRFHTTAMCSPTRASLLTGRNHHRVGSGQITELANDWDGYSGQIPRSSALAAEVLKDYGYSTGAWGKWHNTPADETTAAGPFENWPTGLGFEYFYGFLAGEASQYEPHLVRNTTVVRPTENARARDTTSARIWRMTPSAGCVTTGRSSLTSRFTCTGPQAACTAHITS